MEILPLTECLQLHLQDFLSLASPLLWPSPRPLACQRPTLYLTWDRAGEIITEQITKLLLACNKDVLGL